MTHEEPPFPPAATGGGDPSSPRHAVPTKPPEGPPGAEARGARVRVHVAIAGFAAEALLRRRARSVVVLACLVLTLAPATLILALADGLAAQSRALLAAGPDLFVTFDRLGSPAPFPMDLAIRAAALPGVARAIPRITGRGIVAGRVVQIVGEDGLDPLMHAALTEGRLPEAGAPEAIVGAALAGEGPALGRRIAIQAFQTRIFEIVGVMDAAAPLAASRVVATSFDTARSLFDEDGPTEILLWADATRRADVVASALALSPRVRVRDRDLWNGIASRGIQLRSGAVMALFSPGLATMVGLVLVSSGPYAAERRREAGLLRAAGFTPSQTAEAIFLEDFLLGAHGGALALLAALLWGTWFHAAYLAPLLFSEIATSAGVAPLHFGGATVLAPFTLALGVTILGSLPAAIAAARGDASDLLSP